MFGIGKVTPVSVETPQQQKKRILASAASLEKLAAQHTPELDAEIEAAALVYFTAEEAPRRAEMKRLQKVGLLHDKLVELQRKRDEVDGARRSLIRLRKTHPEAFGLPVQPPSPVIPHSLAGVGQPAPDFLKIQEENAKVPTSLPWGSLDGSGCQVGQQADPSYRPVGDLVNEDKKTPVVMPG